MLNWIKRFTLSLFSDSAAKSSITAGFANILLTSFLAVAFLFLGIFAGQNVTFAAHYGGADDFREFVYNALGGSENTKPINVEVKNGAAAITSGGESVLINTFENEDDANIYSVNGYHFAADSRNVSATYDEFEAYCVKYGGKDEITYEEYSALSESEKQNYRFAVRYTGKQKQITDSDAGAYKEYLATVKDEDITAQLKEIDDKKAQLSAEDYNNSVYELYLKAYYPDLYRATGESVPTLRGYYYGLTLKSQGKYFCLFGDMVAASFKSYSSGAITFGGLYKDGIGLSSDGAANSAAAIDKFVKDIYFGSLPMLFLMDLLSVISVIVVTELIIVGGMLLCFAISKLKKNELCNTFGKCAKLVASYMHIAAFIAAVAALCLGFAFTGTVVAIIAYITFAVILFVRTCVFMLRGKNQAELASSDSGGDYGLRTDLI